ncbi:MAG: LysM peptidoglycan-binding domain-containing protein [Nitrospinae bacterium]|nr:LysM peptidoglycan-binding domain-containing protein [Nitrospinota bacterium]
MWHALILLIFSLVAVCPALSEASRDPETEIKLEGLDGTASINPDSVVSDKEGPREISPQFAVPPALRSRVDFWKKIYSIYTTRQVVIHDNDDLNIIYEVVDLDAHPKRYVIERKRRIVSILNRLAGNKGNAITSEEEAIAAKFGHIPGNRKFSDAAEGVRLQLGQADRFKKGLERSGKYINYIREVFRAYGLPEELSALPHVESSFNYKAYSSVGAAGIWQFMRYTGRLFMRVDYTVDERRDPIAATEAAARLLRINYNELQSWPLAITAYNHGLNGMKNAKRLHGDDMAEIINNYKSKSFGFASKNFYSEFMAAMEVSRDYKKYFEAVEFEPEYRFREVVLTKSVAPSTVAAALKIPVETLKEHNLSLRPVVWTGKRPIPAGYRLRAPVTTNMDTLIRTNVAMASDERRPAPSLASARLMNKPSSKRVEYITHIARKGETLRSIAATYGTTVAALKKANRLRSLKVRRGMKLRVPETLYETIEVASLDNRLPAPVTVKQAVVNDIKQVALPSSPLEGAAVKAAVADEAQEQESPDFHYVKRGETLFAISKKYGLTVAQISSLNGLSKKARIHPGQKLILDGGEVEDSTSDMGTQVASLSPVVPAPVASRNASDDLASIEPDQKSFAKNYMEPIITQDGAAFTINGKTLKVRPQDFSVRVINSGVGLVKIKSEETLGHYADWLNVSRRQILRLNGRSAAKSFRIGGSVKVPLNKVSRDKFERKRMEYHMGIIEDFFSDFRVDGEKVVTVGRGQTIWDIVSSEPNEPPLWLVRLYNNNSKIESLRPNDTIAIPLVVRK